MQAKEVNEHGAWVFFTPDDLLTISNALNEVCNGLDLPEFATRMAVEREEALSLLRNVTELYNRVVRHHAELSQTPR
jgi:hypothetical protein